MRSRILRPLAVIVVAVALAVGFAVPSNAATGPAGEVFTKLNQQRAANGLPALVSDPVLDNAAYQWANYLATNGLFLHSSSSWRNSMISGAGWKNSGENIAAGQTSATSVMNAWMASPGHRNNILNANYTGVGVGYVTGGPYGFYWVQIFASGLPPVTAGSAPAISGAATVGGTLTATTSGWPGGTSIGWTWQANGATIPGATSATYSPTISDAGRTLTATATGTKSGYLSASKTSGATAAVAGGPTATRLAGADRFATAVAISQNGFSPGVEVVYVASGLGFPDALSAAPAASLDGGPLLLTAPDSLPSVVRDELARLAPQRIVVVGGPASVSTAVATALNGIAPTSRLAGADRFETSRLIVDDTFETTTIAYLATGLNFPDALTASAAAAHLSAPVLLVNGAAASLDSDTIPLLTSLGVTTVRIAGGPASVSNGIQSQLSGAGFSVERVAGTDRFETANAINKQVFSSTPLVYLASGMTFPDALAGAALAGSKGAPLFVATSGCIPNSVSKAITSTGATSVVLLGGPATLTSAVSSFQRC